MDIIKRVPWFYRGEDAYYGYMDLFGPVVVDREPRSKQKIELIISSTSKNGKKMKCASFDGKKYHLLMVRKTQDDRISRIMEPGKDYLENGCNHPAIYEFYYKNQPAYALRLLGFTDYGIPDSDFIRTHIGEVEQFLDHIIKIGGHFDIGKDGGFEKMSYVHLKANGWLLFFNGEYKNSINDFKYVKDEWRKAKALAAKYCRQYGIKGTAVGKDSASSDADMKPTKNQVEMSSFIEITTNVKIPKDFFESREKAFEFISKNIMSFDGIMKRKGL